MQYHPGVSYLSPYGYFKSSASASGNASTVHPPHNGTNNWATYTSCAPCHAKADCKVCHTSVPHSTHSQPTKTFACVDCHKDLPTATQPQCTSCHPGKDVPHGGDHSLIESNKATCAVSGCHDQGDLVAIHAYEGFGCDACHGPNHEYSYELSQRDCAYCHPSFTGTTVHEIHSTLDCLKCHPAAAGCSLCHGTKYTQANWGPSSHMKHEGKVLCGSCHGVPEKTALDSSGKYCAICHGKPMPYTSGNVAGIHKKHAEAYGDSPDMCISCHGESVPAVTPKTSCSVCHGTKYTYTTTRTSATQIQSVCREHKRKVDCSLCHSGESLPIAPKRETGKQLACLLCHGREDYRTPNEVHREEEHRSLWCDVCHDSNIPQGVKCVDCHGSRFVRPRTYTTSALHNDHAGRLMPCSVCHAGLGSSSVSTSLSGSQSQDQTISSVFSAFTPNLGVITVVALSIAVCVVFLKRTKKHL